MATLDHIRAPLGRRVFDVANHLILISLAVLCLVPLVHVFMISLSSAAAAGAGKVVLWPVEFTLQSYEFVVRRAQFMLSLWTTIRVTFLGAGLSMVLIPLVAYPLSKEPERFRARTIITWLLFFTMLFHGGLIPTYIVVKSTGIMNTIWALVVPTAVPVFHVILLLNFFRKLPKELEEAAFMDGASHYTVLFRIFIPLSKAALATILLFQLVYHWNEWFFGMIYMNRPEKQPLMSYLRTIIAADLMFDMATIEDIQRFQEVSTETSKAAQIFVAAMPIILTYPFLQRYFAKGITLGSVKG